MVDTYDINTIRYEKFEFFSREVICPVYLHGGLITDIETSFLCLHSSFSSALLLADKVGIEVSIITYQLPRVARLANI